MLYLDYESQDSLVVMGQLAKDAARDALGAQRRILLSTPNTCAAGSLELVGRLELSGHKRPHLPACNLGCSIQVVE